VGKTSLTINVAVAMARLGYKVGILDADFALGNIDVLLGLTPEAHLGSVLDGVKQIRDIAIDGPSGVRIIPAGSGVRALAALNDDRWIRLIGALDEVGSDLDFLFFDTASGITDNVLDVVGLADYALVITSYDPAAVVDAYAIIKLISSADPAKPIGVVVNLARDSEEGGNVFRQISLAASRYLGRELRYDGHIVEDHRVRESAFAQLPLLLGADPAGPATGCIRRVASSLVTARPNGSGGPWPAPPNPIDRVTPAATMEAPRCA
jgi:flagellar biosynthesis protein FlhG